MADEGEESTKSNTETSESIEKELPSNSNNNSETDGDLDALLDDALEDFDKPLKKSIINEDVGTCSKGDAKESLPNSAFEEDAFLKMTEGWDDVLQEMAKEDPNMMSEFQKFQENFKAGMAGNAHGGSLDDNIAKTLNDLTNNLDGLEMDNQMPDFEEMMKEMSADGAVNDGDAFMGMMQGMMENLLSKDLLYPSLKEIRDKYPSWLEKNKMKLTEDEVTRYKHQEEIVRRLCEQFEKESEDDSASVIKERSGKIVDLMQKMQMYGQPPTDMMNEIAAETGAEAKLPQPPPLPTDCCVM